MKIYQNSTDTIILTKVHWFRTFMTLPHFKHQNDKRKCKNENQNPHQSIPSLNVNASLTRIFDSISQFVLSVSNNFNFSFIFSIPLKFMCYFISMYTHTYRSSHTPINLNKYVLFEYTIKNVNEMTNRKMLFRSLFSYFE